MESYLARARSSRLSSSRAAETMSSGSSSSLSYSILPTPRDDGRSCLWSPATTTFLALYIEGTPFSTYIWDASSKISMSNMPISRGRISDTTSGVRSHTRTPLNSS